MDIDLKQDITISKPCISVDSKSIIVYDYCYGDDKSYNCYQLVSSSVLDDCQEQELLNLQEQSLTLHWMFIIDLSHRYIDLKSGPIIVIINKVSKEMKPIEDFVMVEDECDEHEYIMVE
jgi:hypothetical protein